MSDCANKVSQSVSQTQIPVQDNSAVSTVLSGWNRSQGSLRFRPGPQLPHQARLKSVPNPAVEGCILDHRAKCHRAKWQDFIGMVPISSCHIWGCWSPWSPHLVVLGIVNFGCATDCNIYHLCGYLVNRYELVWMEPQHSFVHFTNFR